MIMAIKHKAEIIINKKVEMMQIGFDLRGNIVLKHEYILLGETHVLEVGRSRTSMH